MSVSSIRLITEHHGKALFEQTELISNWPDTLGTDYVRAETDSGMVPVVTIDPEVKDKGTGKKLGWHELRFCMAHELGSRTVYYGGNFSGGIEETGRRLFDCAVKANFGKQTQLYSVGDSTSWKRRQVDEQFGSNGTYLIDLMHLCDYLAEAAPSYTKVPAAELDEQKVRLTSTRQPPPFKSLLSHLESPSTTEENGPCA